MTVWGFIAVFLAYILTDVAWAYYTLHTAAKNPIKAANSSLLIVLTTAVSVIAYQSSHWYVIPAGIGGWLATYAVVKRELDKE